MAAPIGPGDWVEVVRLSGDPAEDAAMPMHSIWCVEAATDTGLACDHCTPGAYPALKLVGNPDDDWCGCSYRPIYRPKADLIQSLKAPPNLSPREVEVA
jgi:hypothetical protein